MTDRPLDYPASPSVRTSRSNWALVRGVRATLRWFRDDWKALPPSAWRRWLVTLLIGFVVTAGVTAALTLWARDRLAPNGMQAWDEQTLRRIERNQLVSFSNAILLESFGNLAYLIPLTVTAFVLAARANRPLLAVSFLVVYWLQRPLVLLGWQLWDRARPQFIADGLAAPGLHSFPSGHAALVVSTYGLLTWLWIRRSRSVVERLLAVALFVALVTVVCWARLRLGSHWPSDIAAGVVIGLLWLATAVMALWRAEKVGGR